MPTTDRVNEGMDIFDLLLRNTGESASCHSDQPWTVTINDDTSSRSGDADDFLNALLQESSSVPASPLWSPCTTDSGINEEALTDHTDSPHPISCSAFPEFDIHAYSKPPSVGNQPPANEKTPDIRVDLGWDSAGLHEDFGITYYLTTNQNPLLSSSHTLTVKDLLLSNLGQKVQRTPQQSLEELNLNEDEKKLLAKEGIHLPSKLPLSKFEERVLKKIRRKIRNKRSAQESRKKKREYVDSLEGRMSACSAHNLELQRKIQDLEETNNALLEKLRRLQTLFPNSSGKTTNRTGTCMLVLLLSFSLLISSSLQPNPYSQQSPAEYTETKASSRSLLSADETGGVSPPPIVLHPSISRGFEVLRSLTEKLQAWTDLPAADHPSSHHLDHREKDDYLSHLRRNV